jgi:hypothetical protein
VVGDERDDVGFVVDDQHALAARSRRRRHASVGWSRRTILATIISIATGLCPPRGTIRSA